MYQININRNEYNTPVNMDVIRAVCAAWLTDEQPDQAESIYVEFGKVVEAVAAINAAGYTTDEDEDAA